MKKYKYSYEGFLDYYFETGEICFPMLQDKRGIDNKGFYSWDWTFVFNKKPAYLIILNNEDQIVFEGEWIFDINNTVINQYYSSPKDIEPKKWKEYCLKKYKAKVYTNNPVDAEINQIQLGYKKISLFEYKDGSWFLIDTGDSRELKENQSFCLRVKRKDSLGFYQIITEKVLNFKVILESENKSTISFLTEDKKQYKIEVN